VIKKTFKNNEWFKLKEFTIDKSFEDIKRMLITIKGSFKYGRNLRDNLLNLKKS
jgi:aspartate carbamoyltransferase catalytic subunit